MNSVISDPAASESSAADPLNADRLANDTRAEYVRPFVRCLNVEQTKFGSHSAGDGTNSS